MRHLSILEYGYSLGISGGRLLIKEKGELIAEYALCRIKSILVAKRGVSISSNLITALAGRGIKLFFYNSTDEIVSCLYDAFSHGSVGVRERQFAFIRSGEAVDLARMLIWSKLRAQRTVLKYFAKYKTKENWQNTIILEQAAQSLQGIMAELHERKFSEELYHDQVKWREIIMGYEGTGARIYWKVLVESKYFPQNFRTRVGRGAGDIVNMALNYGYAVLSTVMQNAIINAGMELYAGILHSNVPGKPSLLLDVIEEYRPIVVDRAIIKMRSVFRDTDTSLTEKQRKRIIQEVYQAMASRRVYRGRKITMESIIQRQMFRLAGTFCGQKKYRPFSYKW